MRMSPERRSAVFTAISEPTLRLRIDLGYSAERPLAMAEIDRRLFQLESEIWCGVRKALGLDGTP